MVQTLAETIICRSGESGSSQRSASPAVTAKPKINPRRTKALINMPLTYSVTPGLLNHTALAVGVDGVRVHGFEPALNGVLLAGGVHDRELGSSFGSVAVSGRSALVEASPTTGQANVAQAPLHVQAFKSALSTDAEPSLFS